MVFLQKPTMWGPLVLRWFIKPNKCSYRMGKRPGAADPFLIGGLETEGLVEILKARKELPSSALANLKLSPKLQVKRGRLHQSFSPFYSKRCGFSGCQAWQTSQEATEAGAWPVCPWTRFKPWGCGQMAPLNACRSNSCGLSRCQSVANVSRRRRPWPESLLPGP